MAARPRSCCMSVIEAQIEACSPRPQRSTSSPVRALKYFTAVRGRGLSARGGGEAGRDAALPTRLAVTRALRRAPRRQS